MAPKKAEHLFVFAGYRGSGKTTALKLAREGGEKFPIFPPNTMEDFKRIPPNPEGQQDNAGFRRYDDFPILVQTATPIMGVHYDMVMPIQNRARHLQANAPGNYMSNLTTPKMWTDLLHKMVAQGQIEKCLKDHFFQLVQLSNRYKKTDVSVLMSDWETNRADWVSRFEQTNDASIDERRKYLRHSFNLALFDEDVELGKHIYDMTHNFWLKTLKEGGSRHFVIKRTEGHYDVKAVNFPVQRVAKASKK